MTAAYVRENREMHDRRFVGEGAGAVGDAAADGSTSIEGVSAAKRRNGHNLDLES